MNNNLNKERMMRFVNLIKKASGENTLKNFWLNICNIYNIEYLNNLMKGRVTYFPNKEILRRIASNSGNKVTYPELLNCCDYEYNFSNRNYYRGQIYFADLWGSKGSEQSRIRPVLILQNNVGNKYSPTVTCATITSQSKAKLPTHVEIDTTCGLTSNSIVLCEQVKTLDKIRLYEYVGKLNQQHMQQVNNALKIEFNLQHNNFDMQHATNLLIDIVRYNKTLKKLTQYNVLIDKHEIITKQKLEKEFKDYCISCKKDYKIVIQQIKNKMQLSNKQQNIRQNNTVNKIQYQYA